eukprot:8720040-Ditylum_brightwellii.AAC.1
MGGQGATTALFSSIIPTQNAVTKQGTYKKSKRTPSPNYLKIKCALLPHFYAYAAKVSKVASQKEGFVSNK